MDASAATIKTDIARLDRAMSTVLACTVYETRNLRTSLSSGYCAAIPARRGKSAGRFAATAVPMRAR
jgi:hypothetical protein